MVNGSSADSSSRVRFLSDNGGPTRELTSSNKPLCGEKGSVYEGGIRVPLLARWPGRLPAGAEYDMPVSSIDIFATAATVAGAAPHHERTLDGVNLLPYLSGESSGRPHETLFWRQGGNTAVRVGDWKLLRHGGQANGPWELYDVARDSGEAHNLADAEPQRREALLRVWQDLNGEMAAAAFR